MKNSYIKSAILFLIFLTSSHDAAAQIFKEKADIIKEEGNNYTSGTTDQGNDYIVYKYNFETDASGKYIRLKVIYFVNIESGKIICNMWEIVEPSSETNSGVAYFKKKGYVGIGYLEWKDYENSILYTIKVDDEFCTVRAVFDDEK